jgi:hypothetical protein
MRKIEEENRVKNKIICMESGISIYSIQFIYECIFPAIINDDHSFFSFICTQSFILFIQRLVRKLESVSISKKSDYGRDKLEKEWSKSRSLVAMLSNQVRIPILEKDIKVEKDTMKVFLN